MTYRGLDNWITGGAIDLPSSKPAVDAYQIIAWRNDGLIDDHEAHAQLDAIQVRGAFRGLSYIGYDYANQQWIETA